MALTNRERIIMILAGIAIGVLVADRYVLGPIFERRSEMSQSKQRLEGEVEQAHATLQRRKVISRRWHQMQQAGLSSDIEKIEGILFRFLETSSDRSGFLLTSIQPERLTQEGQIGQIDFMVSGTGTMDAVTRFLWDIEMAEVPIRIDSMQLSANDENASQMSLQLKLSSIYLTKITDEKETRS